MPAGSALRPLTQQSLAATGCHLLDAFNPPEVTLVSPALQVMTDLVRLPAATIAAEASLDEAHQSMVVRGVRLLLVAESDGQVQGMVTAADLQGERPLLASLEKDVSRRELRVQDVMTGLVQIDALSIDQVRHASVGEVVETLKLNGRTHALVVGPDARGGVALVGIFSAAQIARQLGTPIQTHEMARTFAEIEHVIAHH